jgi:Mg-chelatase subunit ChlD
MNEADQKSEGLRRWRLILGGGSADGIACPLDGRDLQIDQALEMLYDGDGARQGGLGASAPKVARWLGDIRDYFPSAVVQLMQRDAIDRLNLKRLLMEPEMLESVQADVHLVADLISLASVMPNKAKETARMVVRKVVEELTRKLDQPMRHAVRGSLNRAARNVRPRYNEIDWGRTIRANLGTFSPTTRTIIPEKRIGYGRKRGSLRDIILCVDQSGSMAASVVYASIFAAVMASLPAVSTRIVVFDTSVVDLTEKLSDPVELLFGVQLGGGTDINRALAYCEQHITRPRETIVVLISDLIEGGVRENMLRRVASMVHAGAQFVALLALNDDGAPCFDHENAAALAQLGVPAFACTPDLFPDLMAAAIRRQDLTQWAAKHGVDAGTRAAQ